MRLNVTGMRSVALVRPSHAPDSSVPMLRWLGSVGGVAPVSWTRRSSFTATESTPNLTAAVEPSGTASPAQNPAASSSTVNGVCRRRRTGTPGWCRNQTRPHPGAWQQGSESGGGGSFHHKGWELFRQVRAAVGLVAVPTHLGYLAGIP